MCFSRSARESALSSRVTYVPLVVGRSEEPVGTGVTMASPGVWACELLEPTRDMAAPFLDGVEGGGGRLEEIEGSRGRLTAIVSPVFSVGAGRFFAWLAGGASVLSERSLRFGGNANMRLNVCRSRLDIRKVTTSRLLSLGLESSSSSSSCSTGAFLAVVDLCRSSMGSSLSRSSCAP